MGVLAHGLLIMAHGALVLGHKFRQSFRWRGEYPISGTHPCPQLVKRPQFALARLEEGPEGDVRPVA